MEKIEKLKIPKTKYQLGIKDDNGENLIELKMVGKKVNEIIDRLKEQPEEYKPEKVEIKEIVDILQEALDYLVYERDGEKFWIRDFDINLWKYLPERYKRLSFNQSQKQPEGCEHDFNCDGYCVKCHIRDMQVEESKIEKQEGEGEELDLKKEIAKIFAEEEVALLLADSLQEKLVDFISQLLSERTFSKEELEWILSFIFGEGTRPRDGMGMKVLEKISKLLNEKEDEQI